MAVINQIYSLINNANKQAWGANALQVVDERSLIAMGDYVLNSGNSASLDVWTGSLVDQISKIIFVNRPLSVDNLGLSRDESEWGAITVKYRVKPIDVEHNTEYDLGNEDFDPFSVVTPTVDRKMFNKKGTYLAKVTVTDQQIFTAFTSEAQMQAFYSLIYKQLDDAMTRSENAWDHLALANFIGEKINLQASQTGKLHALNILAEYNEVFNKSLTAAKVYTDGDFLRYFASRVIELKGLMAEETDAFNASTGYVSQTPAEYLQVFVHNAIDARLPGYLYSDTYHNEMVTLAGYHTVKYWQGIKNADGKYFGNDATTAINVKLASDSTGATTIEQGGILAVLMDRDACGTFYNRPQAESWRVPTKGVNSVKNVTREMFNDVYENGIVIYVADVNVSADISEQKKNEITTAYGIDIDETQSNVTINGFDVTATLAYVAEATTFPMDKGHHFLALEVDAGGKTVKIKVDPTQGAGWVTLDSDGIFVAQVNENTKGIYLDVEGNISYITLHLTLQDQA